MALFDRNRWHHHSEIASKFRFSSMHGRLLKATEDDGNEQTIPAFKRMGTGFKTVYTNQKFGLGLIAFYAKDEVNSIAVVPEDKGVLPKENLVLSLEGNYNITDNLDVMTVYASSALTQDLRASETKNNPGNSLAGLFFNNRSSTEYYQAVKAGFNYRINSSSMGVAYERIDPGYETLGTYYFNNDFENITLNAATVAFNNRLNFAFNIGYQRDDLENQKDNATRRMVGAANISANLNDRLSLTGSYSNFRTFTNVKMNQFDIINDENLLDNNLDTLNYRQLSQNATLGLNYLVSRSESLQQNIMANYNVSDVANEQNGVVRTGGATTFHNFNSAYTISLPAEQLNITGAVNATYINTDDTTTWGPTLGVNKGFFENRLNTGLSSSYNVSQNNIARTTVTNLRASATYTFKELHNFSLSAIQLFRSATANNTEGLKEFTGTFGYNYSFSISPDFKKKRLQD